MTIARGRLLACWTRWLVIGIGSLLLAGHAVAWVATAAIFAETATLHVPTVQSAIMLALGLVVLRAGALGRRHRRGVIVCALAAALVAFVAVPFPERFESTGIMASRAEIERDRNGFEDRFSAGRGGDVNFHSHLGDVLMGALDNAFGRSPESSVRAFDTSSRLLGLVFLLELGLVGAWHRWSRQSCRYIGLALAMPLSLLFFGFRSLGYFCMAVGAVPLLALGRSRRTVEGDASTLVAGALQGFHTAFHGFGMLGVAGGALAAPSGSGPLLRRLVRTGTFISSAVALYLGWFFIYVTIAGLGMTWNRTLGYRPLFAPLIFDNRIANPLFSLAGLGEFGLFSLLSGVPLLGLAVLSRRRGAVVPAILYSVPGLLFLVRWWPVSAPFNLDLLLSAFPGVFAACWVMATSRRRSVTAFVVLAGLHMLLWTTVGNAMFLRVWVADLP